MYIYIYIYIYIYMCAYIKMTEIGTIITSPKRIQKTKSRGHF